MKTIYQLRGERPPSLRKAMQTEVTTCQTHAAKTCHRTTGAPPALLLLPLPGCGRLPGRKAAIARAQTPNVPAHGVGAGDSGRKGGGTHVNPSHHL